MIGALGSFQASSFKIDALGLAITGVSNWGNALLSPIFHLHGSSGVLRGSL